MTIEEAKIILINRGFVEINGDLVFDGNKWRNAITVISKWLEQEPCEDCISRKSAIDAMIKLEQDDIECYGCAIPEGFNSTPVIEALNSLPSVTPLPKRHEKLTNHEWIDFLTEQFDISRTSAKDMLHAMMSVKKEDNFKKQFSQGKKGFSQGFSQGRK